MVSQNGKQYKSELLYESTLQEARAINAVRVITGYIRTKKIRRKALMKRILSNPDLMRKVVKIQALLRAHIVRQSHMHIVSKIRKDGIKRTKKYKQISKLQACIKGFLFRLRRKRLLDKVGKNMKDEFGDLEEDDDFDPEQFFGIKEHLMESRQQEDEDLMFKAI